MCTGSDLELLLAGRALEVGSRASEVVDIALEVPVFCQKSCFLYQGCRTSDLDDAPLMIGYCAE